MAPRRAPTRRETSIPANRRGARGGIRKNTRNRQPPNRYGQSVDPVPRSSNSQEQIEPSSTSNEMEPSTPRYSHSPSQNIQPSISRTLSLEGTPTAPATPTIPSEEYRESSPLQESDMPINLSMIQQLLRSHQQEIVDRVINQLSSENHVQQLNTSHISLPPSPTIVNPLLPQSNPTHARIGELESQLAELRGQIAAEERRQIHEPGRASTYIPTQHRTQPAGESASTMADSVENLFPGVERGTLIQIIENRFKPTNIYRLLASEKERAESQRTISIGGVEFEQAERDGKESEYRMSSFFKAWAAYCGIIVKLAPHAVQGDLATALSICTMNLYDLLEKYTWEGVKAYHFQFHRKRVASGKSIYQPTEWRQLDSELVASKCFAYPVQRAQWPQIPRVLQGFPRRAQEPSGRENPGSPHYPPPAAGTASAISPFDRRGNYNTAFPTASYSLLPTMGNSPLTLQACRNWNFRECRAANCRYQHICATCGSNHRAPQCPSGSNGQGQLSRIRPHGR